MGWQASHNPQPGKEPGPGGCLPELIAGFAHGGPWDAAPPSALLAAALEAAAGPDGGYEGADTDALVGMVRQWAAVESWAAAGLLGALRAMMREDRDGSPLLRRRAGLPDGWDDSLNYEVAAALAMGPVSAGNLASLAWTLGTRLPGVGLLAGGTLTRAKAKLIAAVFEPLDERRGGPRRGAGPARGARQDLLPGRAPRLAGRPRGRPGRRRAAPVGGGDANAPGSPSSGKSPARSACPAATSRRPGPGRARQRRRPGQAVRGVRRVPRPDDLLPGGARLPAPPQRRDRRRRDHLRPHRHAEPPNARQGEDGDTSDLATAKDPTATERIRGTRPARRARDTGSRSDAGEGSHGDAGGLTAAPGTRRRRSR